jgi:hypothetical protein
MEGAMGDMQFAKWRGQRGFGGGALRPRGRSLASLHASDLDGRFYAWRGASGRSYVCSVFSREERAVVAGFSAAAIVGVAAEGAARRPLFVLSSREFRALAAAGEGFCGATEWHVHFCKDDAELRDLAGSLLN